MAVSVGELLVQGNAVEVLDGEMLDICNSWFDSVCHSICEKYGNLKIFVVSIIGLQSSGKSTLLNALFACKFAVSVGRCTRGLFMRILFLEKELATELGVDALVVLDTEGLGAPEKLTDENCEQKDRLLATFTMSVSNLTLINVLGESIRDLSDILQIVIVTMARLEKADISPDICMIQHLSERDTSKVMQGENEFANALQEAVALTEKKDMKMGIRNSKSLHMLEQRIKNGDLARLFPPFKNGATVNAPPSEKYHEAVTDLYKMILETIKKTKTTQTFHRWHDLIHSYWDAVSKQDYALRFKNIREIQDFIERGKSIANVKSIVDDAFRKHRDDLKKDLRTCFNQFLSSRKANSEWKKVKMNFLQRTTETLKCLPHNCPGSCVKCAEAFEQRSSMFKSVEGKPCEQETQDTIYKHIQQSRHAIHKNLDQMADALVVAHGRCAEFDEIVSKIIKEKLSSKSHYRDDEVDAIVQEVWCLVLQKVCANIKVTPVVRKILDEVEIEYEGNPDIERGVREDLLPELAKIKAFKNYLHSDYLAILDSTYLESQLDALAETVMVKFGSKQFETGMIRKINELIEEVLNQFEIKIKNKLTPTFKWKAIVFALIKFSRTMQDNEQKWNEQNSPKHILEKKKDEYRNKIKIWLQHGFRYESEGKLIGERLLTVIRQLAQKQGDEEHAKLVAGHTWLISSENVRLKYFVDLAKEVQSGRKDRAVTHFSSPKSSITLWFNNEVNSISREKGEKEFRQTAISEYDRTTQAIRNIETAESLINFVKEYLTLAEGLEYNPQSNLDFDAATPEQFEIFKSAAIRKMTDDKESLFRDINIMSPSKHEKIQKILGCSEHCRLCGALCWGEYGHDNNEDDTKKHHACHQASGLIGTSYYGSNCLVPESCDMYEGTRKFYSSSWPDGMNWEKAKLHGWSSDWIFTSHSKNQFNELMKWFFANLHNKIAASSEAKPAAHSQLSELGFSSLPTLNYITSGIESRLGKK